MKTELLRSTPGQERITKAILGDCRYAAAESANMLRRRYYTVPVSRQVVSLMQEVTDRQLHFSQEAALRSQFVDGVVGNFDAIAVRKVRTPEEAFSNGRSSSDYPARIIDLTLSQKESQADDKAAWWERDFKYFDDEQQTRRWNCSLYVGRGVVPVLIDQAAINGAADHSRTPSYDNRYDAVSDLADQLPSQQVLFPEYDEFTAIGRAVHAAVMQDYSLGETLLACISEAEEGGGYGRTTHMWLKDAANRVGILYCNSLGD